MWRSCRTAIVALLLSCWPALTHAGGDKVIVRWNAVTLDAIRQTTLPPPAVARALAIVHTCMYETYGVGMLQAFRAAAR